jgi:undecaprenyl-phosphate galactose phosphotransferase/putative colanic acid biosynthesis UDP-glucose lipid carrier transferase
VGDLAIIVGAAVLSALVDHTFLPNSHIYDGRYVLIGAICFANFAIIGLAHNSYGIDTLLNFRRQIRDVAAHWTSVSMLTLSLILATTARRDISIVATVILLVTGLLALLVWRRCLQLWLKRSVETGRLVTKRIILIADREEIADADPLSQLRTVGYASAITLNYERNASNASLRDLFNVAIRIANEEPIDSIVLLADWRDATFLAQAAASLRVLPLSVHLLPDRRTARLINSGTTLIAGLPSAELQRAPLTRNERIAKRAFDILISTTALLLLSPLFVIVALLIKLDSHGPAFFRQTRNGFSGRPFRILKFRTMNVAEEGPQFRQVTRGDARVTRLGRLLRRTSIDELPQLWNVLIGEMSLVGPRPHPTALDAEYQSRIGNYAFRHHVKPGLTGWAQVHGLRGETRTLDRMERRVVHDLYYINHWSLWLDVMILLLTLRVLFRDPAAF